MSPADEVFARSVAYAVDPAFVRTTDAVGIVESAAAMSLIGAYRTPSSGGRCSEVRSEISHSTTWGWAVSAQDEAVVRRFYEQMNNERKNELAPELFTDDHVMHDPQVPAGTGPQGMVDVVNTYQDGVDGHWGIEEIFSTDNRVVVRWTGSGTHIGEVNGIPATGKTIKVDAIAIHRMQDGKIAESWEVWDTLGFLQQLGVVPAG